MESFREGFGELAKTQGKRALNMVLVVITSQDQALGLEFLIQRVGEPKIYRVTNLLGEGNASVFLADEEVFSSNTPDVIKTLQLYLSRRFVNAFQIQIIDYSKIG